MFEMIKNFYKGIFIIQAFCLAALLAITTLFFTVLSYIAAPFLLVFTGICALIMILGRVIVCNAFNTLSYSASDRRAIEEARKRDEHAKKKNAESRRAAIEEHSKSYKNLIAATDEAIRDCEAKLRATNYTISVSILPPKYRNLDAVNYMIERLSGAVSMADSLKEAMLQYEAHVIENDRYWAEKSRQELDRWEREQRDREQKEHNDRMEELARKRAREAEKAREEAEKTRQIAEDMKRKYW